MTKSDELTTVGTKEKENKEDIIIIKIQNKVL